MNENNGNEEVRVRRAPKYGRFMVVGGGIGAIITFILTAIFPVDPNIGFAALFGYFALFGVTGGVLLGASIALLLDRRSLRRAVDARAERETREQPATPEQPDPGQHLS